MRVIAEELPGATSLAAGAMWRPYLVELKDKVERRSRHAPRMFGELASDLAIGVRPNSGIEVSWHVDVPLDWATTLPGFRPREAAGPPIGFYHPTVSLVDMPVYLSCLRRRLADRGATVE